MSFSLLFSFFLYFFLCFSIFFFLMSTHSSTSSKCPHSPSATPKGKKAKSFTSFSTQPPVLLFTFYMNTGDSALHSLSISSSHSFSSFYDLFSGSPEEFTQKWSNVLKNITVIFSNQVIGSVSIIAQIVPIFIRLSNFIFFTISSPILIVKSEGCHLAKKLFYFASENYAQINSAFSIINEKKLSHSITQIVDDSNLDLTNKLENLSS